MFGKYRETINFNKKLKKGGVATWVAKTRHCFTTAGHCRYGRNGTATRKHQQMLLIQSDILLERFS